MAGSPEQGISLSLRFCRYANLARNKRLQQGEKGEVGTLVEIGSVCV